MVETLLDLERVVTGPEHLELMYELGNPNLPIHNHREEIVEAIRENSVVILAGPTGSGKTTQVPQFAREMQNEHGEPLFNDIIVTQPRIVAARTVSERVREEVTESDNPHSVGYYTSKEGTEEPQRNQDIALLTDGKAAAQLLYEGETNNSDSKRLLIIDEVHEWNLNIEQLVAIATEKTNPNSPLYDENLTVVIMSATMDCARLQRHFAHLSPPLVEVSVPTHGVTKTMSTQSVASISLQKALETSSKVLAFFAGVRDILNAADVIEGKQTGDNIIPVIALHGQQTADEQDLAFLEYPFGSIVAATNAAETSITVPDATVVVDSGELFEDKIRFDLVPGGSEGLYLIDASQANLDQRAGRVGRTAPGEYVLCSPDGKAPLVPYENRTEYAVPAIQRSRLDGLILRLSATDYSVDDFKFFHKPPDEAVRSAKNRLEVLGAIDKEGVITERGRKMDALPLDSEYACMIVFAYENGYSEEVIRNIVDIVSIMQTGGILKRSPKEQKWRDLLEKDEGNEVKEKDSDFFAQLEAYVELIGIDESKWEQYDVYEHSAEQVNKNRASLLKRLGLSPDPALTVEEDNRQTVLNCINAGQLNQIWRRNGEYWNLAVGFSEEFEIADTSVVNRLGKLATGSLFSLGIRNDTFHNLQNLNSTTLETLELVAAHLLVESEVHSSRHFDDELQEFVTTVERKLGNLVVRSFERVVEVAHDSDEARIYSAELNTRLFKAWSAKNPVDDDHTIDDLNYMIENPTSIEFGTDPITGETLYAWLGAKGWVSSKEVAAKSLEANLRKLENAPKIAERTAQKVVVKDIRTQLIKFRKGNVEVREFLNNLKRAGKDNLLDERIREGQELLSRLTD